MKKIIIALLAIAAFTGCAFFSPSGVNVTNNTGTAVTITVYKVGSFSDEQIATASIADGSDYFVDVASHVPMFGSYENGVLVETEFLLVLNGNYYRGTESVSFGELGVVAPEINLSANAAYVTLTHDDTNSWTTVTASQSSGTLFQTNQIGDEIGSNFSNGDVIDFPALPGDRFLGWGSLGLSTSVSLGITTSDIGTDVSINLSSIIP